MEHTGHLVFIIHDQLVRYSIVAFCVRKLREFIKVNSEPADTALLKFSFSHILVILEFRLLHEIVDGERVRIRWLVE